MFNTFLAAASGLTPPPGLVKGKDYTWIIILLVAILSIVAIIMLIREITNKYNNKGDE